MSRTSLASCSLAGLGDLRPALERIRQLPALVLLGELSFQRLPGFLRQPDLQLLPGRGRVVAAHYHDVRKQRIEERALVTVLSGRAADHPAKEPARAVKSEEPDGLQRLIVLAWLDRRAPLGP